MSGKRFNPRLPSTYRPYASLSAIADTMTAAKLAGRRATSLGFVGQSGMAVGATPVYEPPADWWAIKTEVGAGEYTVHRQIWDTSGAGVFADDPRSDSMPAWHVGLVASIAVGTILMGRVMPLLDGTLAMLFGPVQGVGLYQVSRDGGVAGDKTTDCTWTYTVMNLVGTTVKKDSAGNDAVLMTPATSRLHFVAYWYAGQNRGAPLGLTSNYALAAYDGSDLILLTCFGEIGKEEICT